MKLDEAISKAMELDLSSETNIYKIAIREPGKVSFLTECDTTTCRALSSNKKRADAAIAIIDEIAGKMIAGRAKSRLEQAMNILREMR